MSEWLKTVGAIVAAIGLVGGFVAWSHSELRSDLRALSSDIADVRKDVAGVRESLARDIAEVRERLARIEGHLEIPSRRAQ